MANMAIDRRNLLDLAESISQSVKFITDLLHEEELPQPSFCADASLQFASGSDHGKLQEARMSLLASTLAIEQLVTGPQDYIIWHSLTVWGLPSTMTCSVLIVRR